MQIDDAPYGEIPFPHQPVSPDFTVADDPGLAAAPSAVGNHPGLDLGWPEHSFDPYA